MSILILAALLQAAAPAPTPSPTATGDRQDIVVTATPGVPVPLTAPACLAVANQLVRVAEGARLLLAARSDAGSTDAAAQAVHVDWQHRIDGVDQLITNIHVAYPRGDADETLYPVLRTLDTAGILHEGERCAVRPAPVPTPAP